MSSFPDNYQAVTISVIGGFITTIIATILAPIILKRLSRRSRGRVEDVVLKDYDTSIQEYLRSIRRRDQTISYLEGKNEKQAAIIGLLRQKNDQEMQEIRKLHGQLKSIRTDQDSADAENNSRLI
jgi:hypothetical protein